MTAERKKKPDPERTEPNRNGTFYRARGWGSAKGTHGTNGRDAKRGGRFGAGVMEALGACQKLLDQQVRRGGARPQDAGSPFGHLGDQAERMIRTMSDAVIDMSSMWFDYLGSLWGGEDRDRDEHDAGESADAEPRANVDVTPADRAHATLDLRHGARLETLKFQPLLDGDGQPARITLDLARGPRGPWLRVTVADEQPAGRFHALGLDGTSGAIGGTLTVVVENAG